MNNLKKKIIILGVILGMGISIKVIVSIVDNQEICAQKGSITQRVVTKNSETTIQNNPMLVEKMVVKNVKDSYLVIKKGSKKQVKVTLSPRNTSNQTITWVSSDETVVSVSEHGVLKGKKVGKAKITAITKDGSNKKVVFTVDIIPKGSKVYKNGFYYHGITSGLKARINGKSYKENPNIKYKDLRYIRVKHYGYNGKVRTGELIVNKKIANDIVEIFYQLYRKKYPIQKMALIDDYNADDVASMEANNTSAFNYRVMEGGTKLSNHAYGMAIDLNPKINPYISKGSTYIIPKNGKKYIVRNVNKCKGKYKENMIQKGDFVYQLFTKYGFQWGGDWNSIKDYQHFERR